jgi:hypothetical protein
MNEIITCKTFILFYVLLPTTPLQILHLKLQYTKTFVFSFKIKASPMQENMNELENSAINNNGNFSLKN